MHSARVSAFGFYYYPNTRTLLQLKGLFLLTAIVGGNLPGKRCGLGPAGFPGNLPPVAAAAVPL